MKNKVTTPESSYNEQETLGRALACIENADRGDAISYLKELLEHNPEHEIATGMLAALYTELGMTARATEYFKRVLAINPKNPLASAQLGLLQFSMQQAQAALDSWKICLENPKEFVLHLYSGLALLQLNKPDEARPMFEVAMKHMPEAHWLYPQLQELLKNLQE